MNNIDKLGLTSSAVYDAGYKQGVADTKAGKPYDVEKEQADATYNSPAYKEFKAAEAKELEAVRKEVSPYGYCPTCGAAGSQMERSPDGYTYCPNGHKHKHAEFHRPVVLKPTLAQNIAQAIAELDADPTMAKGPALHAIGIIVANHHSCCGSTSNPCMCGLNAPKSK